MFMVVEIYRESLGFKRSEKHDGETSKKLSRKRHIFQLLKDFK